MPPARVRRGSVPELGTVPLSQSTDHPFSPYAWSMWDKRSDEGWCDMQKQVSKWHFPSSFWKGEGQVGKLFKRLREIHTLAFTNDIVTNGAGLNAFVSSYTSVVWFYRSVTFLQL